MQVTFHRAFDFARDQDEAMDALLALGVDRVLTSGGASSALEGAYALQRLVERAGNSLTVMAGGAITASNVAEVVRLSGVREVHLRAAVSVESAMSFRRRAVTLSRPNVPGDYDRVVTQAGEVARTMNALADLANQ
ncbi:MAG: copper homeostasis protein CutC, partial [bacterium]